MVTVHLFRNVQLCSFLFEYLDPSSDWRTIEKILLLFFPQGKQMSAEILHFVTTISNFAINRQRWRWWKIFLWNFLISCKLLFHFSILPEEISVNCPFSCWQVTFKPNKPSIPHQWSLWINALVKASISLDLSNHILCRILNTTLL